MATDWVKDKQWSDQFLSEVKAIVGATLIGEAPVEEDQERNTDLIVLKMDAIRIACRIRRNSYLVAYADEFTVRAGRPRGAKTELTKIIEGWGDYVFYGFASADECRLAAWLVGDLNVFRLWFNRQIVACGGEPPGSYKQNYDGSSSFAAFNVRELPDTFIVAHKKATKQPCIGDSQAF